MKLDFPIELCPRNPNSDIETRISIGVQIAQSSRIKFVGIAKDAAPYINRNIEICKYIGERFANYDIYVYENDSTDNTVDILKHHNIAFDSEKRPDLAYTRDDSPDIDPYHYKRCVKLVEARNRYMSLDYSDYDYVCVIDWDIKGGWWIEGFFHALTALNYLPEAGAVGAYGMLGEGTGKVQLENCDLKNRLMYDSFAYRSKNAPERLHISQVGVFNYVRTSIGDNPIEVNSNFGGITMYKKEALSGRTYSAKHWEPENGDVDCDHVCLHRGMREDGYKIYMDPTFISSHSPHRYQL